MIEIKFDKVFILDDEKHLIGYQEWQNFEQPDGSIKPERVNAIMLITADEDGFKQSDPDGVERDYWLNQIGVLDDDSFQKSAKKLGAKEERKKLFDLLKKEFENQ